jgi:DASS family divalent anion:Na+ symporter
VAADLVLAPAMPSNTARAGGVIFPVAKALAMAYGSEPGCAGEGGTARKIGAYLTFTAFQGTVITGAMFLTGMAANPLAQKFAASQKVEITWGNWALAALVPGLASLLIVPWLIYKLFPPEIKDTPEAVEMAKDALAKLGPVKKSEWFMAGTFVLLLALWIFGGMLLSMDATAAALVGLAVLIVTGVLGWDDVLKETGAWDTLVWFAALVMMATFLNTLGLIPWFTLLVGKAMQGIGWQVAFPILALVYFYAHYLFASNTAHVTAMYAPFLAVLIGTGAPPLVSALVLAFYSNLFSSMTHYGTGPAPVFFGSGYVELKHWWILGFIVSVANLTIWFLLGWVWWKVLGMF